MGSPAESASFHRMSPSECPALDRRPLAQNLPSMETDTVVVGNGPSAMILSYILHGHLPFYSSNTPHPDNLLHAKLENNPQLLNADVNALTEHFAASRLSYSTQALPVNVLLDTLVRPSVDVNDAECTTNVEWRYVPERAVPHLVFGNAPHPGGQWTDNPMPASWEIQTLSYATMLSLPGYSFAEHHRRVTGKDLAAFTRPSRQEVAEYFRAYPEAAQIDNAFQSNESLTGVSRTDRGFYIRSHNLHCKHLVLASGIFSEVLEPRPLLRPLLSHQPSREYPLLVIGSGFSAADVVISAPKDQKIIHVFKWDPESRPSPLRSCHYQAYPEYAGVYRVMKRAAVSAEANGKRPKNRRPMSTPFLESRCWDEVYEGLPNTEIIGVKMGDEHATVTFRQNNGTILSRPVRGLVSATGRRGSLRYLDDNLLSEVVGPVNGSGADPIVSGQTLRSKALENLELAQDIFAIGSLTGDSLVRFAYGGCVQTAGCLIRAYAGEETERTGSGRVSVPSSEASPSVMNGIDGHEIYKSGDTSFEAEKDVIPPLTEQLGISSLWRLLIRIWKWE